MLTRHNEEKDLILDGRPTAIVTSPAGELWSVTQNGKLYKEDQLILDIKHQLAPRNAFYDETGLLGLAFHPTDADKYYLYYTARGNKSYNYFFFRDNEAAAPNHVWDESQYNCVLTVEEYQNHKPVRKILQVKQPYHNHVGKANLIPRHAANKLVLALGDGGREEDPLNLAQNNTYLAGKVLVIDLASAAAMTAPIARVAELPAWVTVEAKGIRNPVGVDQSDDGKTTFLAMAGGKLQEAAYAYQGSGVNFGWRDYEGTERTKYDPALGEFKRQAPFLAYKHGEKPFNKLVVVLSAGAYLAPNYYFTDWYNGLYETPVDLNDLTKQGEITQVTDVKFSEYSALGKHDGRLVIGGKKGGKWSLSFYG